jgi:hypothetical protein
MMQLRLLLRQRYLHIAVADGSSQPPQQRREICAAALWGRGLALVDSVAAQWGSLTIDGGKVVWAMLENGEPHLAIGRHIRGCGRLFDQTAGIRLTNHEAPTARAGYLPPS